MNSYEYLLSDINNIKGIGTKTSKLFKKKNINTIFDLLWSLPRDTIDRTNLVKINELQIGKVQTITIDVKKYYLQIIFLYCNFPYINEKKQSNKGKQWQIQTSINRYLFQLNIGEN